MKTKQVTVVPYCEDWPQEFEKIKAPIAAVLGSLAIGIEHVGSTSVPGLWAKPIIDLDVIIREKSCLPQVIAKLAAIGYQHEGNLGIPDRDAFCYENKPELMKHHLYVCPQSSAEWNRHRALRDYLRSHPDMAEEYGCVKRVAAMRFPQDMDGYIAYKSSVIQKIYQSCAAEAEKQS